jgi:hypothetical protein
MNSLELNRTIQSFVASDSISPSTLRGQGAKGVVAIARQYLATLDLQPFGVSSQKDFTNHLDKCTLSLQRRFPEGARNWGAARKAINVFLRNCYYNQFLCVQFNLHLAVAFYEVPLDSFVAGELRKFDTQNVLPKWPGVKNLDKQTSAIYQSVLGQIAIQSAIDRVHLDVFLWQKQGRALTRR